MYIAHQRALGVKSSSTSRKATSVVGVSLSNRVAAALWRDAMLNPTTNQRRTAWPGAQVARSERRESPPQICLLPTSHCGRLLNGVSAAKGDRGAG